MILIGSGAIVIIAIAFYLMNRTSPNDEVKDTLDTIQTAYTDEKTGMIHAYPDDTKSQSLSESAGLYMKYLIGAGKKEAFADYFDRFQKQFVVEKDGSTFIRWKLDDKTHVNALIDDLRIVGALKMAARSFEEPKYEALSDKITASIKQKQRVDDVVVDYYDWQTDQPASRITLSYLTLDYFTHFAENKREQELLDEAGKTEGVFFPEYYDVKKDKFFEQDEVHMIDQLLIATNRAYLNIESPQFLKWLKDNWEKDGKIYGRYSRESGKASVTYESLSVYYYLQQYFDSVGQENTAAHVRTRMDELAKHGDEKGQHFFDYIHYRQLLLEH